MSNGNAISYYDIQERYKEEWGKGNKINYDQARHLIRQDKLAQTQRASVNPASILPGATDPTDLQQLSQYKRADVDPGSAEGVLKPWKYEDPQNEHPLDSLWDAVGGAIWGFGKIGTFGLTDLASRKLLGDEQVDEVLADWSSSKAGRMAMMLGEAGGFLKGMGIVKSITAKVPNAVPLLTGTTRGLQRTAGTKLAKDINKLALQNVNKTGISAKETQQLVKEMTDDVIGFGNSSSLASRTKGSWDFLNPFVHSQKPYMGMRTGSSYVNTAVSALRQTTPSKIHSFLKSKNIQASAKQITAMSDDVISQVSKNPINNLDDLIVGRWGGKVSQVAGGIAQEAMDLAITGTLIDAHMYANGELKPLPGQSYGELFGERLLHHGLTGAAFGALRTGLGIPFLMGGSSLPAYKKMMKGIDKTPWADDALKAFGGNVKGFNKHISKIKDPNEMKEIIKMTMETNRNFNLKLGDGRLLHHGSPLLKRGVGLTKNDLPALKRALIKWNDDKLEMFRAGLPKDLAKDLIFSSPRWLGGAVIMNWSGLNSGMFDSMDPDEAAAHFILSAWMSKRGKPLRSKGGSEPQFGLHQGERPYYYNSELVEIHNTMRSLGYNTQNISDIVRAYDNNIWETHQSKTENRDVQEIIKVLERNNIVYNKDEYIDKHGGSDLRHDGTGEVMQADLSRLIAPISGYMSARGYKFNPNHKKIEMATSVSEIHKIKSSILSTTDNPIALTSDNRVSHSVIKGNEVLWNKKTLQIFDHYKAQIELLTGDPTFIQGDRVKNRITFDRNELELSTVQDRAVGELLRLQQNLEDYNIIKIQELKVGPEYGHDVQKSLKANAKTLGETHQNLIEGLGREVFGESSNEVIDINAPDLWMMIGRNIFNRNVRANYDILFNNKEGLPSDIKASQIDDLVGLVHRMLTPKSHLSDKSTIVDNVLNLKMETDSESFRQAYAENPTEIKELATMMSNMYSIMKTGKSPVGGTSKYSIEQARELKGKLIELGMPDPTRRNGEDFREWTQKMISHGTNEAVGGLDIGPELSYSINRLMENGLIWNHKGNNQLGSRLEMTREITAEDIARLNPNYKPDQIKELMDLYIHVVDNIPNKAVNKTERIGQLNLTEQQLATIRAASTAINSNNHFIKSQELHQPIIDIFSNLQETRQILESTLKDQNTMEPSDIEAIKMKMRLVDQQEQAMTEWDFKFWENIQGDITRSASFYHHVMNTRIDGKSMSELFAEMNTARESLEMETFDTISNTIRGLQTEIARKWFNRPEVFTDIEIQREESFLHHQAEELQGKLNSDNKNTMTPDNFFVEYADLKDISVMDKVSGEIVAAGGQQKPYDTATEALYDLYEKTANSNNSKGFRDALYRVAGMKSGQRPPAKLKNDVVKLHNLFERQFSVNRVQVNLSGDNQTLSYTGTFRRSQISKSSFTDIYTEILPNTELNLLSDEILYRNRLSTIRGEATGTDGLFENLVNTINQDRFLITELSGATKNQKLAREGTTVEVGPDMYQTFDLNKEGFTGKQYIVGVDENINFLLPNSEFHQLANSFKSWYNRVSKSPYVTNAIKNHRGAEQLFERLAEYDKYLSESLLDNKYSTDLFKVQSKMSSNRLMNKAVHEMFNVIYGERIDGDWLQSAYAENMSYKDFKYKRLASNQGYTRNTEKRRLFLQDIWGTDNTYIGNIVNKYTPMTTYNNLVIDDAGTVSQTEKASTGYITDNRSIAERSVNNLFRDGKINNSQRDFMLEKLFTSESINAEHVNAATITRKDYLDYILVSEANSQLIGESAGHKPVGISSFTDANGNLHVFYNKTHYFYDKKFNEFFKNNPNVQQITFTSGAKKAKIINSNDSNLSNNLKTIKGPLVTDGVDLPTWLNNKNNFNELAFTDGSNGVMVVDANQNLIGATYGASKGAKILKQLGNWSNNQEILYKWSRADAAKNFGSITYNLYDPARPGEASSFARQYLGEKTNKGNAHNPENENISMAALWINGEGVPFSRVSKNLYDNMIKSRFIDDGGVFDGFTSAGGHPILRPDFSGSLNIPIYQDIGGKEVQTILGEANVGYDYLARTIPYTGKFGTAKIEKGIKPGKRKVNAEDVSTLTIAFSVPHKTKGSRDIMVDIKNGLFYDPFGDIVEFNKLPKKSRELVKYLSDNIDNGKIVEFREVVNDLRRLAPKYVEANLIALVSPSPRTGPHDLIPVKIKNTIPSKDGGVVELNSYDLTLRAQRDHDTDKLPIYLDTPFEMLSESFKTNSLISEAKALAPGLKEKPIYDPYNADDFFAHKGRIKDADFLRGIVQKEQRLLDYSKHIFDKIESIEIQIGDYKHELVFSKHSLNMQRLTNDSQGILDPYDGVPRNIFDGGWQRNTRFGRSDHYGDKSGRVTVEDQPFFQMKIDGKNNLVTEPILEAIANKIMKDYGNLLTTESGIWQAGERKTVRYADIISLMRNFKNEYHPKRINWNFYNTLKEAGVQGIEQVFFPKGDTSKPINNILGKLANAVNKSPTTFLKSMEAITQNDLMSVRENVNPQGDYFNQGVMKMIGRYRGEVLESIKAGEGIPELVGETPIVDELWNSFKRRNKTDEMMVQLNTLEEQISSLESVLSRKFEQGLGNSPEIKRLADDVMIKRNALISMSDKLMLENSDQLPDITIVKGGKNVETFGAGVLRNAKTGKVIATFPSGSKDIKVEKGQTFIKGGVQLIPVTNHDMLDATALANTTLGYYSHISQGDLSRFKQIVSSARKEIRKDMSATMEYSGHKDWSRHYAKVQEIIDRSLIDIEALANKNSDFSETVSTSVGNYPKNKETYGLDFLMGLLVPEARSLKDHSVYYNPKTSTFLPAVRNINKSVIDAVFQSLKNYNLVPDLNNFIKDLAKTHRLNYEVLTAGEGFELSARKLQETTFEGALLNHVIDNVMHDPFMSRKEYKTFSENAELYSGIGSEFAELYRQIIQEGTMTDPGSLFRLKKRLIESYGQEAYDNLFFQSRGEIIFDGVVSRQFSNSTGEGQLIGQVLNEKAWKKYNAPRVERKGNPAAEIRRIGNEIIGENNLRKMKKKKGGCD